MKKAILMRRADANALAARAQARPADPALGRELQALEDHAQDLDSDLAGLDCDLRGLIARAPALVSIKDRVSFLPVDRRRAQPYGMPGRRLSPRRAAARNARSALAQTRGGRRPRR